MRLKQAAVLTLAVLTLSCGVKSRNQVLQKPNPADQAFDGVTYQPDDTKKNFRYLSSVMPSFGKAGPYGKTIYVFCKLYLYKSRNFKLIYEENLGCFKNGQIFSYPISANSVDGKWKVTPDWRLKLGDIGSASKNGPDDSRGIVLSLNQDLGRSVPKGWAFGLERTQGPDGLDEGTPYNNPNVISPEQANELLNASGNCIK